MINILYLGSCSQKLKLNFDRVVSRIDPHPLADYIAIILRGVRSQL